MADNRTGLSAADLAKSFRDMAGDGSMEWVTGPTHMWVLLDAADMLDENEQLREQGERLLDKTLELGTENDKLREERDTYRDLVDCMVHPDIPDQLYAENAKLRELVRDMWRGATTRMDFAERHAFCGEFVDRMRELGVSGHD